jgi:hypothetical protein
MLTWTHVQLAGRGGFLEDFMSPWNLYLFACWASLAVLLISTCFRGMPPEEGPMENQDPTQEQLLLRADGNALNFALKSVDALYRAESLEEILNDYSDALNTRVELSAEVERIGNFTFVPLRDVERKSTTFLRLIPNDQQWSGESSTWLLDTGWKKTDS